MLRKKPHILPLEASSHSLLFLRAWPGKLLIFFFVSFVSFVVRLFSSFASFYDALIPASRITLSHFSISRWR